MTQKSIRCWPAQAKSNWKRVDSPTLGIRDQLLKSGSRLAPWYQPRNWQMMPRIQVARMPMRMEPFTL